MSMPFHVIAGLGNPGTRYAKTRHNVGFMLVDRLAADAQAEQGLRLMGGQKRSNPWQERFDALVCPVNFIGGANEQREQKSFDSETVWLIKPQDFMNRSGRSVEALLSFYKIPVTEVIVIHDELDIPLGALRIKRGGGDGGHNGLKSLTSLCGGPDYVRIRVGIDRPTFTQDGTDEAVSSWVLGNFTAEELPIVSETMSRASEAVHTLMSEGLKAAQNRFNG